MDRGFCGMPSPENEFLSIFRWLEKPKEQISLLTTNKELYQRIPRLEIDKNIAFGYLCNNYDTLSDEACLSPSLLKPFSLNAVELKCGDPSFPLQIQFLVFTRFFRLGYLKSPLKLLIDSKKSPQDGEVDALLKKMDASNPI